MSFLDSERNNRARVGGDMGGRNGTHLRRSLRWCRLSPWMTTSSITAVQIGDRRREAFSRSSVVCCSGSSSCVPADWFRACKLLSTIIVTSQASFPYSPVPSVSGPTLRRVEAVSDVTFSRCIIAENLSRSLHPKGKNSKGLLIGDHSRRISCSTPCLPRQVPAVRRRRRRRLHEPRGVASRTGEGCQHEHAERVELLSR